MMRTSASKRARWNARMRSSSSPRPRAVTPFAFWRFRRHTQGEAIEECLANAREVLALVLECRIDRGEDIPPSEFSVDSDSPWIAFEDRITSFPTSMVGKRSYPYTPSRRRNPACYMAFTRRRIVAERSAKISENRKKKGATKALFFFRRDRCYRLRASS